MSQQLSILKPKTAIEKRTSTTVDTIMVTAERLSKWKLPSGQRPLTENNKVRTLALQIKDDGGVIPGVLTIGVLEGAKYIIDGQHRLHAFTLSGCTEGYADVRFLHAQSMSDINREFVELNSKLVTMRPDDFLRGLEGSLPALQRIRQACPFVGYDQIRRGTSGPTVLTVIACIWGVLMALTVALCVIEREEPHAGLVGLLALLAGSPAWGWLAARYLL